MARPRGDRRRRRQGRKKEPEAQGSAADELRSALAELRDRQERSSRRKRGRRRHTDDYRELVLDGTKPEQLSESLLDLTRQSYRARRNLAGQEASRLELPSIAGDPETARAKLRRQAENATQHIKEDMHRKGLAERDHYYSASERSQTGEIDRTYDLGRRAED